MFYLPFLFDALNIFFIQASSYASDVIFCTVIFFVPYMLIGPLAKSCLLISIWTGLNIDISQFLRH